MTHHILYSFRRCPYAMRARLAIASSGIEVELREVVLRNKPASLLEVSPKATVPVLITAEGEVIDESIDIMQWALSQHDPHHWLITPENADYELSQSLIANNDNDFKHWLDRYKYADRYPEQSELYYRQQAEKTVMRLEELLQVNQYLLADTPNQTDIALLPFIRQFANVDYEWFETSPYPLVRKWLNWFVGSSLFSNSMVKYPAWQQGDAALFFPQTD